MIECMTFFTIKATRLAIQRQKNLNLNLCLFHAQKMCLRVANFASKLCMCVVATKKFIVRLEGLLITSTCHAQNVRSDRRLM